MANPSISAAQLFTPAPSGVGLSGVVVTSNPPPGSWLSTWLTIAQIIQLPTTSWQSGCVELELAGISAVQFSQSDALISSFAQSAFLSTAASGTVTYVALNGQTITFPVTPDPSNPAQNPTGALGWLDVTGQNVYDCFRILATYVAGPLAICNLGNVTVGPYSAGTYHVSNVLTGATYSNLASFSAPPSTIAGTGGNVNAVTPGLTTTTLGTVSAHGLVVGATAYVNVPASAGVQGLAGVFALVVAVPTSTSFTIAATSTGSYTGPVGNVYSCTVASMQADVIGTGGNASLNAVTNAITSAPQVLVSNVVSWNGTNYESNGAYAERCTLSLAAASPNGPSQAYEYFARTSQQILSAETPPYTFTNGAIVDANTYASPITGIVTTVVASSTPASTTTGQPVTPGCAQNPVTGVSNASLAVVTCANATGIAVGGTMTVLIEGVVSSTGTLSAAVNGTWLATYVGGSSFSIPVNTAALDSYASGGSVEGGDLGAVDNLLQDNVVPDGVTAITVSALALGISVVASVTVPAANVAIYKAQAPITLQAYFTNNPELPIGGVISSSETVSVSFEQIVAALIDAGVLALGQASYVIGTPVVTVNGGKVDVPFPSNQYQALLALLTLTVTGV